MFGPLADRSNMNMRSSSIVTFNEAKAAAKAEKEKKPKGLNVVPSFSVMSSGMPQEVIAEELIKKGSKKKPVGGQTIDTFFKSITHLHFANKRLLGDIAAITICSNLRVLYVYENRLTTLRGLGGLVHLTHLYAQDNRIESLHDFECPPNLQQLHLGGNKLSVIGGLETCKCLQELHVGSQKLGPAGGVGSIGGDSYSAPPKADVLDLEALEIGDEGGEGLYPGTKEQVSSAPMPAGAAAMAGPTALAFEEASLDAIAPTLQKLVASHCHLDDDAMEPLIVLQSLTSLDLRSNNLCDLGFLQQFLLRMPELMTLQLSGNPLCESVKLKERLIVAAPVLETIDGYTVKPNERRFIESLANRAGSAAGGSAPGTAAPTVSASGSRAMSASHRNRGRPQQLGVSIPSAQSYDLGPRAGLLLGEPPAGFYEDTHQPVSLGLNAGNRRPWSRNPGMA